MNQKTQAKTETDILYPYSHIDTAKIPYQTEYGSGSTPANIATAAEDQVIADVLLEVVGAKP